VGTASTAIAVSKEERSLGEFVDDTLIKAQIKNLYFDSNENIFFNVDVEVTQGRVLLTGTVDNSDLRIDATRMAWGIDGVQTVINELQISNDDNILNFADDLIISAKIKGKLLLDSELPYLNYTVETVNGTVYLIGIAQSEAERKSVIELSKEVYGVVNVIEYINIKSESY
jgi:osmotically-inducible protein OsmY